MIIRYVRVSTEDQSLLVQRQTVQEYAKIQGEECTYLSRKIKWKKE